jgi:hypothetical protein
LRFLILFEALTFALAASIHAGALVAGYEHPRARIAEGVIAAALFAGAAIIWVRPAWTRPVAAGSQGFALLGTLVGIFTILVGVGPRTVPDVIYHLAIIIVLAWGVRSALRIQPDTPRQAR